MSAMSHRLRSTQLALPLLMLSIVACGGGDTPTQTTPPAPPAPTFALALPTTAPVLIPGVVTNVPLNLQRGTGTPQSVTFSLVAPPAGISGTFSPATTSTNDTMLQLSGTAGLAAGTYALTLQAIDGQGNKDTKQLTVVVQAENFTIGTPSFGALYPGAVQTASFPITRKAGFTGAVKLALTSPAGISATFAGEATSTGYLTLTLDPALAGGSYDLTLTASSAGSAPQSSAFKAIVASPAAQGFALAIPVAGPVLKPAMNATVEIALQRFGGFVDTVSYSLENAPAGLTALFTPNSTGASLKLTADAGLAVGTYDVAIKGVAGSLSDSRTLRVQVIAAATPAFRLDSPAAVIMEQGIWEGSRWTATLPVHISRDAGFTDAVDLSVIGLPAGLAASLPPGGLTTSGNDALELSFKTTDTIQPGTYVLTVVATSRLNATLRDARTVKLSVVKNGFGFGMAFLNAASTALDWQTNVAVAAGQSSTYKFLAYTTKSPDLDAQGNAPSYPNPLTLSLDAAPSGVTASFGTNPTLADENNTLTLAVDGAMAPGAYPIRIKAFDPLINRSSWFDVVLTVGKGTFYVMPGQIGVGGIEVAAGQSVTVPVELGRNGIFWTVSNSTGLPTFLGNTDLSVLAIGTGLQVTPSEAIPAGAVTTITIAAGASATPGDYSFTLRAARNGENQDQVIPVKVMAATGNPDLWIQGVEWGQTVLQSALRLVPGKPAMLRAVVLADRSGVASPVVRAVVKTPGLADLTLTLTGPAQVPTAIGPGQLDKSFIVLVPAERIAAGFTVVVTVDPSSAVAETNKANNQATLAPAVGTGRDFDLRIVPILHQGRMPNMPTAADFQKSIHAFWPTRSVNVTFRAPYVMSTVIPPVSDQSGHSSAWGMMRYEMLALRLSDGDAGTAKPGEYYYGMLTQSSLSQVGVLGIHNAGLPAGLGLDQLWQDPDDTARGLNTCVITSVHELGHGFNLRHSPDGQAGGPNVMYPYRQAKIGTWGLDVTAVTPKLYDPAAYFDIMSYTNPLWVSDFNYRNAFAWFESTQGRDWTSALGPGTTAAANRTLISGFINADGTVDLHPVQHLHCPAILPKEGKEVTLQIRTAQGVQTLQVRSENVEDVPGDCRAFAFTLEGQDELQSIQVFRDGQVKAIRTSETSLQARISKLTSTKAGETFTLAEADGTLRLRWDATTHPYAGLIHLDAAGRRTTLALRLTGGDIQVPVAGFEPGGHYELVLSDGLNPIRTMVRSTR